MTGPATATKTKRASALPPDERRSMIVAATLPLLLEHGEMVTTRQIAEAAGIAEGTIFRVFADKDELIAAVIEAALDPEPLEAGARRASTRTSPLEDALAAGGRDPAAAGRSTSGGSCRASGTRFHEHDPPARWPTATRSSRCSRRTARELTVEPIVAAARCCARSRCR